MREFSPIPDPSGALQPPNRYPPTAVGVDTPEPDPAPAPFRRARQRHSFLRRVLNLAVGVPVYGAVLAVRALRGLIHRA